MTGRFPFGASLGIRPKVLGLWVMALIALSACQPGSTLNGGGTDAQGAMTPGGATSTLDIEAPEVFQAEDQALWDGRPSLGGIWVTAPGVRDPERVIIRNMENGQSVIGALYMRERNNPGPPLHLSSEAAAALGVLAGQPVDISVTALRRKEVPVTEIATDATGQAAPVADITATPLEDDTVTTTAAAAIERATPPAQPPAPRTSSLAKPYIQIGIFSIESNATNTASALRNAGLSTQILAQESRGKKFWRVIVGPAQSAAERTSNLRAAKGLGFADAYAVTN